MIVKTSNGEYDDEKLYTALELANNFWWRDHGYRVAMTTGRTKYNKLQLGKKEGVYLVRETVGLYNRKKKTMRNVAPNTPLRLVKPGEL